MKVICILCDQVFRPDPLTEKKSKSIRTGFKFVRNATNESPNK